MLTAAWQIHGVLFAAVAMLFVLALIGRALPGVGGKLLSLPAGFIFLQWCIVRGGWYWLSRKEGGAWK
jgi:hypothetical protein